MRTVWVVVAHAVTGWALCFATIGIGMAVTTTRNALVVHAILAPLFFAGVAWNYHARFGHLSPLATAAAFTGAVITLDFLVVALLILRSMEMFSSVLGTWIPFTLIFVSSWLTGSVVRATSPGGLDPPAEHRSL